MDNSPATSADARLDERMMARAVELARRGRGPTAPNPCVGAVLVRNDQILAEGWHRQYGGPHAERDCLADAADKRVNPRKCTLYVTLEPCNHHGKTPPCTQAVIDARIPRVVVGCVDPNPDVAGGGVQRLREAGAEVVVGVMEQECRDLISDFLVWKETDRAYCILKMASTLDGRIAGPSGAPEPVSSPESFADVHRMRGFADAVIVGGQTFRGDNPSLTCRIDDTVSGPNQPYAVVVTKQLPDSDCDLNLIRNRPTQTIFWTDEDTAESGTARALMEADVRVWGLPWHGKRLDLKAGLTRLRKELDAHYALCEGGGGLAMSMIEQHAADEFVLYLAPRILGDDTAKPLFTGRSVTSLAQTLDLRIARFEPSGPDLRLTLMPK